ncbi:BA75_03286T0 [Komagataella pastoris]|uniref:BA75_03286T0 n=1 Tax=Komagataella pastoris TaxID=4922 RepID=A0A1B2JAS4_PICPA|nr:BA75_03286T0 [Komagataella pastoris]
MSSILHQNVEALTFEIENIVQVLTYKSKLKLSKEEPISRKRGYNQLQDDHEPNPTPISPELAEISKNSVDLAQVDLYSTIDEPDGCSVLKQIGEELTIKDIELSLSDDILIVKSIRKQRLASLPLLSIRLGKIKELVVSHLPFFKRVRIVHRSDHIIIVRPHINFSFSEDAPLTFHLKYKISIHQGIFISFPQNWSTHILNLITKFSWSNPTLFESTSTDYSAPDVPMFYSLVSNATSNWTPPSPEKLIRVPGLNANLFKFQSKTVNWLLGHEGVEYNHDTKTATQLPFYSPPENCDTDTFHNYLIECLNKLSFGWNRIEVDEEVYFYNQYSGNIVSPDKVLPYFKTLAPTNAQGLLSEEMGLGKTVEMIATIMLHPRPESELNSQIFDPVAGRSVKKCKSTLIVCPESILKQWRDDIYNFNPHLKVIFYKGISNNKQFKDPSIIAEHLAENDIILTTYNTVAKEVHYAMYNPTDRPLRKAAKDGRMKAQIEEENATSIPNENDAAKSERIASTLRKQSSDEFVERYDYSSPLVLLQFWRVVLDEVQMVTSKISNAAKICKMIPRAHAWGVSGTPIRNNLDDLQAILSFLRFHPFDDNDSQKRVRIKNPNWELVKSAKPPLTFVRLWSNIALRHTKLMVADDIKLPPQQRIQLSISLTPVERDNYDNLFKTFLSDVALNDKGEPVLENWEPSSTVLTTMRVWLEKLRRICCHAQIGSGNIKKQMFEMVGLKTMDAVLDDILLKVDQDVDTSKRLEILSRCKQGMIYEYMKAPTSALEIWENCLTEIDKQIDALNDLLNGINEGSPVKLEPLDGKEEIEETDTADENGDFSKKGLLKHRLRSWLELLHRCYFFIASAHNQIYNPKLTEEEKESGTRQNLDEVPDELLDKDSLEHRKIERSYYAKAEDIRKELLKERLKQVDNSDKDLLIKTRAFLKNNGFMKENRKTHHKKDADFKDKKDIDVKNSETQLKVDKVNLLKIIQAPDVTGGHFFSFQDDLEGLYHRLNSQAEYVNKWIKVVFSLLTKSIVETEETTGNEMSSYAEEQDKIDKYLSVIQLALTDRGVCLKAARNRGVPTTYRIPSSTKEEESEFQKARVMTGVSITLTQLLDRISLEAGNNDSETLKNAFLEIKGLVSSQVDELSKNLNSASKIITVFNNSFNSRVNYFKGLQQISENVMPYTPIGLDPAAQLRGAEAEENRYKRQVAQAQLRSNYLRSLGNNAESNDERLCIICRSDITIGALTKCGHQYCKDCLKEWLKKSSTCPLCKAHLDHFSIYFFTFTRDDLKASLLTANEADAETEKEEFKKEIYSIYKPMNDETLQEIQDIPIQKMYGSKVDLIVKQALWLKNKISNVQIVVFSQWLELLEVLAIALKQNGLKCIGAKNSLKLEKGSGRNKEKLTDVELFKSDPSITCFLLNARAQAAGLTLVNASHVFLCEPLVNTALELQAISRIHRIGQQHKTTIWMFIIKDTVEESVLRLSTRKRLRLVENKSTEDDGKVLDQNITSDIIDQEELSKTTKGMVHKNIVGGEVVSNEDLWGSIFSAKAQSF